MRDFEETCAGHNKGFCVTMDNNLLKKFQPDSEVEVSFLKNIQNSNDPIKPFIPDFFDIKTINNTKYIEMENLLKNMENTSVMDIKVSVEI